MGKSNRIRNERASDVLFGGPAPKKKKGMLEYERRSAVLCYVCSECGYIELYAENPKELKLAEKN